MIVDEITFYPIVDFPGYYFSLCNKIYREKSYKYPNGLIQAPIISPKGYYQAQLFKDGKRTWKLTHRIIAEYFIPNPENKPFVDHKNHITTDNRIENLRWATHKENCDHAYKYKDSTKGTYWQGVIYEPPGKKTAGRFRALWRDENNKEHRAGFSIEKYGMLSLILAIEKRKEMVDKLYNRPEDEIKSF